MFGERTNGMKSVKTFDHFEKKAYRHQRYRGKTQIFGGF
jgi:hypothetical protein